MTPAIVVLGYNRIKSITRLLKTLDRALYPSEVSVPLIIDLDNCGTEDIYKACCDFEWNHGEKKVILRPERMGLREHVLACGDFSYEYGSIIMFEDDMMVSPMFYKYACEALDFCAGDERIGGVSLYNHLYNVHARRSFAAIDDGCDNWYFQFASSWGQAYTGEQWKLFREWYELHKSADLTGPYVPANVSSWSEKSWLKYHICYLIDTGKYFMYPRVGYSTNCGDAGSHFARANTDLQIPLAAVGALGMGGAVPTNRAGSKPGDEIGAETGNAVGDEIGAEVKSIAGMFRFSSLDESGSVYDAFFENERLSENEFETGNGLEPAESKNAENGFENRIENKCGSEAGDELRDSVDIKSHTGVIVDLYGLKDVEKILEADTGIKMILSSKHLPYKVVKSYGRYMRPVDANIYYEMEGNDFYLYDVSKAADAAGSIQANEAAEYLYEYRGISANQMKIIIGFRIKEKFRK